jgi:hypothetical protein
MAFIAMAPLTDNLRHAPAKVNVFHGYYFAACSFISKKIESGNLTVTVFAVPLPLLELHHF